MDTLNGKTFERTFRIEKVGEVRDSASALDQPLRFKASLSSEEPVKRFYGDEILVHDEGAINLERANGNGLMMLYNHDVDKPLGRAKNVRLTQRRRLEADLEFSRSLPGAEDIERAVRDGTLDDVSIRYSIDEYREEDTRDGSRVEVTRWTPVEVSVVTVPADYSGSGIGRSLHTEGQTMSDSNAPGSTGNTGGDNGRVNVADFEAARAAAIGEGQALGAQRERERLVGIDDIFAACRFNGPAYSALKAECISRGSSVDQTRAAVFDLMNAEPGEQIASQGAPDSEARTPAPSITAGQDESEKLMQGAERALEFKTGIIQGRDVVHEMKSNEFAYMTMPEMAREFLRRSGIDTRGMTRYDVVGYALRPDLAPGARRDLMGHAPADFANLLSSTASKSLLIGFNETDETWNRWTRTSTLPDFKRGERTNLSNFGDLDEIPAGGEYKAGTMSDLVEYITAKKYGKKFGIYRETLINDDLDGLSRAPRAMGRAASRKIGDLVYAILTGNPTLNQDSTQLFAAGHSNIGTAGAPSTTTLDEARKLMALQSDPSSSSAGLNIRPAYLIVPVALETTANILRTAEKDPAEGGTTSFNAPNPFVGTFEVVADPRLDADSAVKWYMAASPTINDTVEVGFVNGQQEPSLESREGWDVDGIEYKTRIECGVSPLDFRGMIYNAGA